MNPEQERKFRNEQRFKSRTEGLTQLHGNVLEQWLAAKDPATKKRLEIELNRLEAKRREIAEECGIVRKISTPEMYLTIGEFDAAGISR